MNIADKVNGSVIDKEKRFDWPLCYEAEKLVLAHIDAFLQRNSFAAKLAERMRAETGTLFIDWVDYIVLPSPAQSALHKSGFVEDPFADVDSTQRVLWHPEAMLPRVIIHPDASSGNHPSALAIHVENLDDFMIVHGSSDSSEGEQFSRFRRITASIENGTRFQVVERRGYRGSVPEPPQPNFSRASD